MVLKVDFSDNDYASVMYDACEDLMYSIANGYEGKDVVNNFLEEVGDYGLEKIRKSIIYASYGHYIVNNSLRLHRDLDKLFEDKDSIIKYLFMSTSISIAPEVAPHDNHETCYIDFYNLKVYLR